jgi:hypothetical protein
LHDASLGAEPLTTRRETSILIAAGAVFAAPNAAWKELDTANQPWRIRKFPSFSVASSATQAHDDYRGGAPV